MLDTRSEIKARLNRVFRETFEDDSIEIFEEMTAKDITEWDSLMHIILVVSVEKEFAIRLNAAQVGQLKNVGEMLDLIAVLGTRGKS
jgi:acyl carrier protein